MVATTFGCNALQNPASYKSNFHTYTLVRSIGVFVRFDVETSWAFFTCIYFIIPSVAQDMLGNVNETMKAAEQTRARTLMVQLARGHLQPAEITAAQERCIKDFCRADVMRRAAKIEEDVQRNALRPAKRKAAALRSSLAGRVHALLLSLPRKLRHHEGLSETERADRRALRWGAVVRSLHDVGQLNCPAMVSLRAKPKGPAGVTGQRAYRPISTFGWIDKARQRLIAFSLEPFVDYHHSQFLLRQSDWGRGRSAVCKALLDRFSAAGPNHVFIQLDVRGFYLNVSHAWLEENLPLPKDVIRAQVHTGGMMFAPIRKNITARLGLDRDGALEAMSRQGMPMGSALSTLVGEYVLAAVLRELADRQEVPLPSVHAPDLHTYSDNLGLFVEQAKAAAVVDLYRRTFASSAAGPFSLTCSAPLPAHGSIKFLGYWLRMRDGNAEVYVPDDVAESKIAAITQDILTASGKELARMRERIIGVGADWKDWAGVIAWKEAALAIVEDADIALACLESGQHSPAKPSPYERPISNGRAPTRRFLQRSDPLHSRCGARERFSRKVGARADHGTL